MNQFPMSKNGIVCDPSLDGKTHINVYSKGGTALGRELSFFAHRPFVHPALGSFQSLEGYYHYIATGCQHENFRFLYGQAAKQTGKMFAKVNQDNFHARIHEGVVAMLTAHVDLRIALAASQLPFAHYYVYNDGWSVTMPEQHHWVVELYESIRYNLQNS